MNWGVLWYIDFADWSVISPCTKAIQTCVKFLVGTRSFTLYVLVQFYGKSEFCKNGRFSLSGSHICIYFVSLETQFLFNMDICWESNWSNRWESVQKLNIIDLRNMKNPPQSQLIIKNKLSVFSKQLINVIQKDRKIKSLH